MNAALRILHLTSSPTEPKAVRAWLGSRGISCESVGVSTRDTFISALLDGESDLILADRTVPGIGGETALAVASRLCPGVPFIILDGTIEDTANGSASVMDRPQLQSLLLAVERAVTHVEERRSHEAATRKVTELVALLDLATDMILMRDLNGRITFWNHGAERTYGWRSEEVLGRNVHELLRTEFPQSLADIEAQLLSTGHWEGDLTTTRADGTSLIVAGHWTLRCDHKGEPVAVLEIHSDLTARRRLESQLLQAQKLEGLGSLVSGIAHDFNNILSGILGCASLLPRSAKPSPNFDKLVNTIISASERGASLVRQLLTFARKSDTKLEPLCINDVVEETLRMLQRTFPKTIEFRLDLSPGIRPILADSGQLYQVLLNLCVNARDAMPDGGLLTISTTPLPADAAQQRFPDAQPIDYVGLRISDTGTGMNAETRRRVFEPFFTTKPMGKGTGIGLAVVYGVVQSHRGFIEIESEPGHGTAFDLFFPAAAGQAMAAHADAPQVEAAGGSETILAVEDEEILRALLATVLEDKGYRVLCAADGLEALEIFLRPPVPIDLVISDLNMPRLGGIPLVQEIRKLAPQQKVLVCSGSIELDMREELAGLAVSGFVDKPYRPGDLVTMVRQTLDAAPPAD